MIVIYVVGWGPGGCAGCALQGTSVQVTVYGLSPSPDHSEEKLLPLMERLGAVYPLFALNTHIQTWESSTDNKIKFRNSPTGRPLQAALRSITSENPLALSFQTQQLFRRTPLLFTSMCCNNYFIRLLSIKSIVFPSSEYSLPNKEILRNRPVTIKQLLVSWNIFFAFERNSLIQKYGIINALCHRQEL